MSVYQTICLDYIYQVTDSQVQNREKGTQNAKFRLFKPLLMDKKSDKNLFFHFIH